MRILLTFAGNRDPYNIDELIAGQKSDGPVLALLREEHFDRLYILTDARLFARARELAAEITRRRPDLTIEITELTLPDPTDYETIFNQLNHHTRALLEQHASDNPSYYISTASGTPQMQTVWFLLARSGLLPATLLKVTPQRFLRAGERAVSEIRLSLAEFPQVNPGELDSLELASLRIQKEKLEAEREVLFREIEAEGIVGTSKTMQKALTILMKTAATEYPVLLLGETGTGKELFAKALHKRSPRAGGPLIAVNCAAIPDTLLESELFGYAPNSGIANADRRGKPGQFELADGGTIFLDEIGDLSVSSQAKVLRVLQEGEVQRLGATAGRRVDVRVVAATHKQLAQMVAEGVFRDDLYYRLNVIPLNLPPLRERREDIPLLIEHFLSQTTRSGSRGKKFSKKALKHLMDYTWPGNIREIENMIKRMATLAEGDVIAEDDIPQEILRDTRAPAVQCLDAIIPVWRDQPQRIPRSLRTIVLSQGHGYERGQSSGRCPTAGHTATHISQAGTRKVRNLDTA